MAHPAFVWRAYYRQNRGSFPSAFPAGKLDALAICEEEEDGEGRKALIARRVTTMPGRMLASPAGVWERERGGPRVPSKATTVGISWDLGSFSPQGGVSEHSCRAGRVLASWHPTAHCALLQGGMFPWRVGRAMSCARCTCSRVPVGRQRAPTDICQA